MEKENITSLCNTLREIIKKKTFQRLRIYSIFKNRGRLIKKKLTFIMYPLLKKIYLKKKIYYNIWIKKAHNIAISNPIKPIKKFCHLMKRKLSNRNTFNIKQSLFMSYITKHIYRHLFNKIKNHNKVVTEKLNKGLKKKRTILIKKKKSKNLAEILVELICKKVCLVHWKRKIVAMKYSVTGYSKKRVNLRLLFKTLSSLYYRKKYDYFINLTNEMKDIINPTVHCSISVSAPVKKNTIKLISYTSKKKKISNTDRGNSKKYLKYMSMLNFSRKINASIKNIMMASIGEMKKIHSIGNKSLDNLNNISVVPVLNDVSSPLFTLSNKNLFLIENSKKIKYEIMNIVNQLYEIKRNDLLHDLRVFTFLFKRREVIRYLVMKKMMRLSKFNEVKPIFEKWRIIKEFICLSKEKINFLSKHFSFTYIKTIKDEITKNIMLTHKKEERNLNTKTKIDHSIDKEFANNVKYI